MIAAVAIDEIHRHIEQPIDIALEAEAVLEEHAAGCPSGHCRYRSRPGRGRTGSPFGLPSGNGELANSAVAIGCSAQRDAELPHHVGFGGEIEIHLHGAGASIMSRPSLPTLGM